MFATLACVVLGVYSMARGLGTVLAVIAFFAWIRTVVNVDSQKADGGEFTLSDKLVIFLRKFASTVLLAVVVMIACAIALFIACLVMLGR